MVVNVLDAYCDFIISLADSGSSAQACRPPRSTIGPTERETSPPRREARVATMCHGLTRAMRSRGLTTAPRHGPPSPRPCSSRHTDVDARPPEVRPPRAASANVSSTEIEIVRVAAREKLNLARRIANSIRFPFNGFTYSLTLFSKSFSSFPHGTCSLSVSCQYLALDGVYHPFWAAFPNSPTL